MKTEELREYYRILSELNNSFTHYSLVWNQFSIDYAEILEKKPDKLTKEYFEKNPYKEKHNIKFRELEAEHKKTHDTLIKGIFLLIYTYFESYLKELLVFANKVDNTIEPLESKLDYSDDYLLIDKVFNRIGIDKSEFKNLFFLTLDYFRLKRNRLIHSNVDNISKSLNYIIKNHGNELNNFWNNILPSNLQGLDFMDKENANELTFSIIIDTINLFRGISAEIDKLVINKLTIEQITIKVVIPAFKEIQGKKINGIESERLKFKFKRFCKTNFGLEINDDILELFKSSIA